MAETNKYDAWFQKFAQANILDWLLLKAQVKAESDFDEKAKSPVGAMGLAQFMPATWGEFGEGDPYDPVQSIKAQAKYMRWLFNFIIKLTRSERYLNEWTLAAYNWGIGRVRNLIQKTNGNFEKAFDKLPDETQKYVKRILKYYAEYNERSISKPRPKSKFITLDQ